jgi:hypothetical protein
MSLDLALDAHLTERARARVGTMLGGKYRLDALLGVGGMASVYRASHRNGAIFAIKVLHPEYAMRGDVRARFLREGYIANSIKHVGVARVVDDEAIENGDVYIVMELLEGVSVDRLVHRDIKPANLFVGFDGRVVLLDFGIARVYDAATTGGLSTAAGVILGTPAFMAPEQASGEKSAIGARTDLWSLGATMFTALSGRTVHVAESGPQFLVQSATRDAQPIREVVPDVPEPIAAVLDRALAREAASRFSDATEMREALIAAARTAWGNVPGASDLALLFAAGKDSDTLQAEAVTLVARAPTTAAPTHAPPGADAFFRAIVQTVRDLGFDADAALAALPGHESTSSNLVDFLEHAAKVGGEPSLGVKTAFSLPLGATGALDYATRTSSTLRDAFERTARLLSYVTDRVRLVIEEEGDRVHLVCRTNEGAPSGPQITEFLVAVVLTRAREALRSGVPLLSIGFRHARIEGGLDLSEMFGAPVAYEQARDEIIMPRSVLFLRFETSDPMVAALLEQHTERLTKRPG